MMQAKIVQARDEAYRFIELSGKLIDEMTIPDGKNYYSCVGTKLSGAVRRASLDLSRSLAEMRKSS